MADDDEQMRRALYFRSQGMSLHDVAKETGISARRIRSEEKRQGQTPGGMVQMVTYTTDYGMVMVDLTEEQASKNAAFLNYVRWTFYTYPTRGGKITSRVFKRRKVPDAQHMRNFSDKYNFDFSLKAVNVYFLDSNNIPHEQPDISGSENDLITLDLEIFIPKLRQLDRIRHGSSATVYARR
jgi:hypothetical protein